MLARRAAVLMLLSLVSIALWLAAGPSPTESQTQFQLLDLLSRVRQFSPVLRHTARGRSP